MFGKSIGAADYLKIADQTVEMNAEPAPEQPDKYEITRPKPPP